MSAQVATPTGELRRIPAVAQQVGLSTATLYRLIAAGQFPAPVHVGRASRLVGAEVDEWISKRIAARDTGTAPPTEGIAA